MNINHKSTSNMSHYDTPSSACVLTGRGGLTNGHAGNVSFRALVQKHQNEYLQARKKEKILIARRIVGIIHSNGGRFLQRSSDGESWVEVTEQRAQQKTSQALREGLDVRNSTVRERKSKIAAADSDDSISSSIEQQQQQAPRKIQKKAAVVQGKVKSSSVSESSLEGGGEGAGDSSVHSIPSLSVEVPTIFAPPSFSVYNRQISKSEVTDACEV